MSPLPAAPPDPANCRVGHGELYFGRFASITDKAPPAFSLGLVLSAEVTPEFTEVELPNFLTADGGIYAKTTVAKKATISCELTEWAARNLANQLFATDAETYSQGAQTVVDENLTGGAAVGPKKGAVYHTKYRQISAITITQAAVTLILNTDYVVENATMGLIRILPAAPNVTENTTPLLIDYTAAVIAAGTVPRVNIYNQAVIEGQLTYLDRAADGPYWDLRWWRVAIKPTGALGLLGDEYGRFTIEFDLLDDSLGNNHDTAIYPSHPFGVAIARA